METPRSDDRTHEPRGRLPRIGALALMLAVLLALALFLTVWTLGGSEVRLGFRPRKPLLVYGTLPDFSLIERGGDPVSLDSLKGGIWIADFIFTRCAGTCPVMTRNMGALANSIRGIPELWPPARLVSFTVDPQWDTPEVLDDYADLHNANEGQWLFVTGQYEQIQKLAIEGFKLGVEQGADSSIEPIVHSQSFVLIDPKGRIRGYYDGTDKARVRELIVDVSRLARER